VRRNLLLLDNELGLLTRGRSSVLLVFTFLSRDWVLTCVK